jgi:hypothetical protein
MVLRVSAFVASCCLATVVWGCAPAGETEAESTTDSALTIPRGDRFIDRIDGDKVILKREVDGVPFPFDAKGIRGKAILIHPVAGKSETGLYGRAVSVDETDRRLTVTTRPLRFEDMENIAEDEVIRIYLDRSLASVVRTRSTMPLSEDPFQLETGVQPRTFSGLVLDEPAVHGWVTIGPGVSAAGTFRAMFENADLALTPQVKFGYVRGRGLELGASFDFRWKAAVSMEGEARVSGTIFSPPEITAAAAVIVVPIGPVPVPVTLALTASTTCWATGKLNVKGKIQPDIGMSVGGSSFIKAAADPAEWFTQGEWPYHADGHASVDLAGDVTMAPGVALSCWLPRIELGAKIVGTAGPNLSLVGTTSTTASGTTVSVALRMGVRGELFGRGAAAEVDLVSWRP